MEELSEDTFSRTKSVLNSFKQSLKCSQCQDIAVNPYTLGQCCHFFCHDCMGAYSGGRCPAPGCPASAPAKSAFPHKTANSLIKSIYSIGQLLGDEIPTRVKRHMSIDEEDDVITEVPSLLFDLPHDPSRMKKFAAKSATTPVSHSLISAKKKTPANSLEKKNPKGETRLHSAAVKGDVTAARMWLEKGANANTVDNAGWSPLHEAAIMGCQELVKLLLDYRANPNIHAQENNVTPLHDAASNGFMAVAVTLVSYGADLNARNSQGLTPLQVAKSADVAAAMRATKCTKTFNCISDKPACEEISSPQTTRLACLDCSDADFKRICQAAAKLKLSKPTESVTESTTHCLVDTVCSRTVCSTMLVGAELVSLEWLFQSKQIGWLVDTDPFRHTLPDQRDDVRLAGRKRSQPKLFAGLHIYLNGAFDTPGLSKSDLQKLIQLSGAKLLNREPNPEDIPEQERTVPHHAEQMSSLIETSHIILYQQGGKREPLLKYNMKHIKTVPSIWFVESCKQYRLLDPLIYIKN